MATVCVCVNCGTHSRTLPGDVKCPLYCADCKTKEKRDEMEKENKLIQDKNV